MENASVEEAAKNNQAIPHKIAQKEKKLKQVELGVQSMQEEGI